MQQVQQQLPQLQVGKCPQRGSSAWQAPRSPQMQHKPQKHVQAHS